MILNRTAAPTASLLSLLDAKTHARIDGNDEDMLIERYAAAAVDMVEQITGRALLAQTWAASVGPVAGRAAFVFPKAPLIALISVSYFDRDNVSQALSVADLTVFSDEDRAWVVPDIGMTWPGMYQRPDALTISWTAGYGTSAAAVPANIVQAVRIMVAEFDANRGADAFSDQARKTLDSLLGLSRLGWVGA